MEVLEGVLKALGSIFDRLDGVFEAMLDQDSTKMTNNSKNNDKQRRRIKDFRACWRLLRASWRRLEGVLEVLEGILEALGGVLETKDNTKMCQERAKRKIPRKLQSGLKPPKHILEALGGVLEILGGS